MDYLFRLPGTKSTPEDPNLGHIWSTPEGRNRPKAIPDLIRYYQGACCGRERDVPSRRLFFRLPRYRVCSESRSPWGLYLNPNLSGARMITTNGYRSHTHLHY